MISVFLHVWMFLKLSLTAYVLMWVPLDLNPIYSVPFIGFYFVVFNLAAKQIAFGDFWHASGSAVLEQILRVVLVFPLLLQDNAQYQF